MKALAFRVWGPFAHFRRVYTTTSASTYSFPPRTALIGLIGAILGVERQAKAEHLKVLGKINVSVVLEEKVRKFRIPVNYHSIKQRGRIQIPMEIIRNPSYIVFVSEFELYDRLKHMIQQKETVFIPYLGITKFIASFEFVGEFVLEHPVFPVDVNSVIPSGKVKIRPKTGVLYLKERAIRVMAENRAYLEHENYILSKECVPITVEEGENIFKAGRWNIVWM